MKKNLSIGIDLGSDTIKIAFAYHYGKSIAYGKFDGKPILTQVALPAVAYYDMLKKEWLFCDQVGKGNATSFVTVVKIKSLISLLSTVNNTLNTREENERISKTNAKYYSSNEHFPKFFFPARRKMLENFEEMVELKNTFVAKGYTPKKVCEMFFSYIEKIISERILELESLTNCSFADYQIAVVHPMSVGEEYLSGLTALIKKVFGKTPHKILNSNKALAIFAEHRNAIDTKDNFLVFDMAEEDISVARIGVKGGSIIIDGQDGHNEPLSIGGVDVDEAIVRRLEKSIAQRETIGTPPFGKDGHISETGIYGKQYLLMKDIKKAKVLFSKPGAVDKFKQGIPVTLSWDLCIQRFLTKEDVSESIGVKTDSGIAKRILEYILQEINRPLNHNVKKIFISGGLTETYSLLEYLTKKINKERPVIQVITFDDYVSKEDGFSIRSFEDSVFAPAVGGAIASLTDREIKVVLSLSYAAWAMPQTKNLMLLQIFANRGEDIEGGKDFTINLTLRRNGVTKDEELFSTFITTEDIYLRTFPCTYYENDLVVGEPNSSARKLAEQLIDLKTVSGGKKGYLRPTYNGRIIEIANGDYIDFKEGMRVDKNGRAHPIVENISNIARTITIYDGGIPRKVFARDVGILTNLTDFDTSNG